MTSSGSAGGRLCVYELRLEGENWYVGYTTDLVARSLQHLARLGAAWTRVHKPQVVAGATFCATTDEAKAVELRRTAELAWIHGWTKVRGAHFCQVYPDDATVRAFAAFCAHILDKPYAEAVKRFLPVPQHCPRCGRFGHSHPRCYYPNAPPSPRR